MPSVTAITQRPIFWLRWLRQRCTPARWRPASWHDRAALALWGCVLLLRVTLLALGWPPTDSDEATMGIMALHIAEHGERPVFFYGPAGQQYMGALESYLAAGIFHFLGPSLVALRLGTLLLSVLALGAVYLLARRLYSPGLALLCLGLLALGPAEPLLRELWSGGGYAETLLCGSVVMLLGTWLAQTAATSGVARRSPWQRLGAFAGWGLAAGLGLWSDMLVLPYVLAAGALLVVCCRREWRAGVPCLAAGLLAGGFPLLVYAVMIPGHNPFAATTGVVWSSDSWRGNVLAQSAGQIVGTLAVALPNITGGTELCPLPPANEWPLASVGAFGLLCTGVHALWGLGAAGLLALAVISPAHVLWRSRRTGTRELPATEVARLALAAGAALTVLLFLASPVAARVPHLNSRYLIGVLIGLPAIIAPLWRAAAPHLPPRVSSLPDVLAWSLAGLRSGWGRLRVAVRAHDGRSGLHPGGGGELPRRGLQQEPWHARRLWAARFALVAVAAAYLLAFVGVARAVPAAQAQSRQRAALIAHLEQSGVSRVYSEYWTCGWLIFATRERVICAALDGRLRPDLDRYPSYRAQVEATPDAAYVFPVGSAQASTFDAQLDAASGRQRYARETYAGYVIYRPPSSR